MRRAAAIALLLACCARPTEVPVPPSGSVADETLAAALRKAADDVRARSADPVAWAALAMTYDANSFDDLAAACYRRALAAKPDEPRWWYGLACVLERENLADEASAAWTRAAALAPDYAPLHRAAALRALARGRLDDAEASARRALAASDGGAGAWTALGRVQLERGDEAAAVESFRKALAAWPAAWGPPSYVRFLLGNALRRAGRMEEAERELAAGRPAEPQVDDPWRAEVMTLRTGFETRMSRAHRLVVADQFAEAESELLALRALRPTHVQVLTDLGTVYLLTSRWNDAIAVLDECARNNPAALDARLLRARALWAAGRRAEAMRAAETLVASNPARGDALELRGLFRLRSSQAADALEDFEAAARLDPTSALAPGMAGAANLALGRLDAAEARFAAALRADPAQPLATAGRAILAMRRGDLAGADALLARLANLADDAAPLLAEARQERRSKGR